VGGSPSYPGLGPPAPGLLKLFRLDPRLAGKIWGETDGGCWMWTGATVKSRQNRARYGSLRRGKERKHWLAHRWVYTLLVGPIPAEDQAHHTCRCKLCVNPAHIEVLSEYDHAVESARWQREQAA
jgi:hypothetical protein